MDECQIKFLFSQLHEIKIILKNSETEFVYNNEKISTPTIVTNSRVGGNIRIWDIISLLKALEA